MIAALTETAVTETAVTETAVTAAAAAAPIRHRPFLAVGVDAALAATSVVGAVLASADWHSFVDSYTLTNLVIGVGFSAAGVTILWFRAQHVIGRLLQGSGLAYLLSAAATSLALYGLASGWPEPVVRTLSARCPPAHGRSVWPACSRWRCCSTRTAGCPGATGVSWSGCC